MKNSRKPDDALYATMTSRLTTSSEVVKSLIYEAIGAQPASIERLTGGIGNEVYKLIFAKETELGTRIMRIHHGAHPEFLLEKWAMAEAAKQSVVVPAVFKVGAYEDTNERLEYCIEEFIEGVSLDEILLSGIGEEDRRAYALQAGEMLARIHSVQTTGFGHMRVNGVAEHTKLADSLQQHTDFPDLLATLQGTVLNSADLEEAVRLIDEVRTDEAPHLLHIDYAPKHIMMHNGAISGIIDFESCMSGHAAADFNRWRTQESRITMGELIVGYERIRKLPADFWSLMYVVQLHSALRTMLFHYRTTGYAPERQRAAVEVEELLRRHKVFCT